MLAAPVDLDDDVLVRALAHWGLEDPRLEYLPAASAAITDVPTAASVTVDDLEAGFQAVDAFDALDHAYRACAPTTGLPKAHDEVPTRA